MYQEIQLTRREGGKESNRWMWVILYIPSRREKDKKPSEASSTGKAHALTPLLSNQAVRSRSDSMDRLSSLPDSLLHHIMSFLTTFQCVTLCICILSKRWKNLWTTLPFLNLDDTEFDDDPEGKRFREFATKTLLLRDSTFSLHTFRLSCYHSFYSSIRSWITCAINCNPRVLDIVLEIGDALPQCLFTCQSLEDVSIKITWVDDPITSRPKFVSLPNLRRLKLNGIQLVDNFLEMIFSGCPLLEDLDLDECKLQFSTLSSATLKYLRIKNHDDDYIIGEGKLIGHINTPSLISFNFDSKVDFLKGGVLVNMPSLVHANLDLHSSFIDVHMGKYNILSGISNAENLTLSFHNTKGLLECLLPTCLEFSNLRNLSLRLCLSCHFNLVASLLVHSPSLKKFTLNDDSSDCPVKDLRLRGYDARHRTKRISTFQCMQLSCVEIIYLNHSDDLDKSVKSLLDGIKGCSNVRVIFRGRRTH